MAKLDTQKHAPLPPLDDSKYAGCESWTNKRWAWEFLRRNMNFRSACDALDDNATSKVKRNIARKFGLVDFKHYQEIFTSDDGQVGAPKFISKAVMRIRPERQDDSSWKRRVTIKPNQLAIRFDLRQAIEDDRILDAQIQSARKILERELNSWRSAENITPKTGRNRPLHRLLVQLKILDAREQPGTIVQQAALVWGPHTQARRLTDAVDDAFNLATKDYLLLAALGDDLPPRK